MDAGCNGVRSHAGTDDPPFPLPSVCIRRGRLFFFPVFISFYTYPRFVLTARCQLTDALGSPGRPSPPTSVKRKKGGSFSLFFYINPVLTFLLLLRWNVSPLHATVVKKKSISSRLAKKEYIKSGRASGRELKCKVTA